MEGYREIAASEAVGSHQIVKLLPRAMIRDFPASRIVTNDYLLSTSYPACGNFVRAALMVKTL